MSRSLALLKATIVYRQPDEGAAATDPAVDTRRATTARMATAMTEKNPRFLRFTDAVSTTARPVYRRCAVRDCVGLCPRGRRVDAGEPTPA
ncbi:hypothetical protein GS4_02_02180 [Gordonia soli NBRC 108243]|uniref:Uncharacterized protein n=1 Tax=Gordonia soli NBRC 108243 TaxID=1223545 RepID=M0QGH9_9ACTN|nr:hypothetical protein GS4_02_02180 [Gordonia soli NBRC 108243]